MAALSLATAALVSSPVATAAQQGRPNVFFDCDGPNCNSQYYRTDITWVNWVNDREVADVHLIMGSISTGAGGREYQLDFLGVGTDYESQLTYESLVTDTDRESLDGLAHTIGLGLANWANQNGYRGLVSLVGPDPELGTVSTRRLVSQDEVNDPWNLWVFRMQLNGNRNSEETSTTTQVNGGFGASRVTPTWKINFQNFVNHRRRRFELSSGTFNDIRTDWNFRQLVAYSIADHWSVGTSSQVQRQTSNNRQLRVEFTPAVEYSFFPYDEATRRSLTAFYTIGPSFTDYIDRTAFLKYYEWTWEQSLEIEFSSRQQWGDASFRMRGSHYLHDIDLNRRELEGRIDYRITRGFSINLRGNIAWVSDQIYLPADDASDEETLLNLQQRATDRESSIGIGFSFQFGSIFNNVVNNRFRNVGGFGGGGGGGGRGGGPF